MARPLSKPSEAQHRAIVEGRRAGLAWDKCAGAARISRTTLAKWRELGEDGTEPYAALLADVQKAEAEAIDNLLAIILDAAADPRHWTAAAWLLERRYPQVYGRRIQEIQGRDGGPVKFEVEWQQPIGGDGDAG